MAGEGTGPTKEGEIKEGEIPVFGFSGQTPVCCVTRA